MLYLPIILGLLLFLIYANGLPSAITCSSTYLFTGGTNSSSELLVMVIPSSKRHCLARDMVSWLETFPTCWEMCCCDIISVPPEALLSINGVPIPFSVSDKHCDLGILVNNKLTWMTTATKLAWSHTILFTWFTALWALVQSNLVYCSQLWRPILIKDIQSLEQLQCGATKYILQDYSSDYELRLVSLNMVPLMYWLELQDLAFFVKSIKYPSDNSNILDYVTFVSSNTRSATTHKLCQMFHWTSVWKDLAI